MENPLPTNAKVEVAIHHNLPLMTSESKDVEALAEKHDHPPLVLPRKTPRDVNIVDFDENDLENPRHWPTWRKWSIVILVTAMRMLVNFGTITIVPAIPQVLAEFHVTDAVYTTLIVSIWELGEGFGPFFIAPLSELYGRMPIYHVGNILFILCSVGAALSINVSMLLGFRFLNGFVLSCSTLGPSIVGDLFRKEERGTAMSLAISLPLIGPFAAPVIGGFVAEVGGWRWTIWIVTLAVGAVTSLSLILFRETYQVKILNRKAKRLQEQTGNKLLRSKYKESADKSSLIQSISRPMKMLFCSPIVFIVSLFTALTYGVSYLILTTLTEVMESTYGLSSGAIGLTFLGRATGNVAGMLLYGFTSDRYARYKQAREGYLKPEHRLPLMLLGALCLPIGLFFYGWTAEKHVQWIAPIVGTAVVGFSMLLTILPTENYLIDVYELHGASAVAAGVILRAIFGALLPLAGPPLYESLGLGWGNSVLAFITIAFILPLGILWRYGESIRNSPRFYRAE